MLTAPATRFRVSSAEVASSSTRIGASLRIARAIEIRWRSPPLSIRPRSPMTVSYPVGQGHDEIVRQRRVGSFFHPLSRGLGMAIRDVVANRVIEQDGVLGDHGDL